MPRTKSNLYSQRELVPVLCELIDAASAKGASAHRDIARSRLREVMRTENWNTTYIHHNLGATRDKYLSGLGYPVPSKWLFRGWAWAPKAKVAEDD